MKPEDMENPIKRLMLLDSNAITFTFKLRLSGSQELLVHYVFRGKHRGKGIYAFTDIEVVEIEE